MILCSMDAREEEAIDTLLLYIIAHGYGNNSGPSVAPPVARLPRAIGGESGAKYIPVSYTHLTLPTNREV